MSEAEILLPEAHAAWFKKSCMEQLAEPQLPAENVRNENPPRVLKCQDCSHDCLSKLTASQTGETMHFSSTTASVIVW